MIKGKKIYLHCQDGQRPALEQRSRNLGADLVESADQADVIYVVGKSANKEEIESYQQRGKMVMLVNQDLINQDLVDKLLSGRIRVRKTDQER
ncbi:MAG: hypothetical protein K2J67_10555 [Lachnospiraceae bacterium]|nr:hypothetical protein [Lachnospiraceae bacterium]